MQLKTTRSRSMGAQGKGQGGRGYPRRSPFHPHVGTLKHVRPASLGTDIAFLGGMIKYILDHDLYFKDYVLSYTNAAFLVNPKFSFNDGLFSGYDAQKHAYDKSSWSFQKDGKGLIKRDATDRQVMIVARFTLAAVLLFGIIIAMDSNSSIFNVVSYAWAGFGASFWPPRAVLPVLEAHDAARWYRRYARRCCVGLRVA